MRSILISLAFALLPLLGCRSVECTANNTYVDMIEQVDLGPRIADLTAAPDLPRTPDLIQPADLGEQCVACDSTPTCAGHCCGIWPECEPSHHDMRPAADAEPCVPCDAEGTCSMRCCGLWPECAERDR